MKLLDKTKTEQKQPEQTKSPDVLSPPLTSTPSISSYSNKSQIKEETKMNTLPSTQTSSLSELDLREFSQLPPETDELDLQEEVIPPNLEGKSLQEQNEILISVLSREKDYKRKVFQENKQLRKHIQVLNKRLVKDIAKTHYAPSLTSKIPTSVEANINLRYHFMKRLEAERFKYESLLEENRRLHTKIQELEDIIAKKSVEKKVDLAKVNEILYWKAKHKEMEKDKQRVEFNLNTTVRQLERETKELERLKNQMDLMRLHFTNLAPKAVQMFESEYKKLASKDPRLGEKISESNEDVTSNRQRTPSPSPGPNVSSQNNGFSEGFYADLALRDNGDYLFAIKSDIKSKIGASQSSKNSSSITSTKLSSRSTQVKKTTTAFASAPTSRSTSNQDLKKDSIKSPVFEKRIASSSRPSTAATSSTKSKPPPAWNSSSNSISVSEKSKTAVESSKRVSFKPDLHSSSNGSKKSLKSPIAPDSDNFSPMVLSDLDSSVNSPSIASSNIETKKDGNSVKIIENNHQDFLKNHVKPSVQDSKDPMKKETSETSSLGLIVELNQPISHNHGTVATTTTTVVTDDNAIHKSVNNRNIEGKDDKKNKTSPPSSPVNEEKTLPAEKKPSSPGLFSFLSKKKATAVTSESDKNSQKETSESGNDEFKYGASPRLTSLEEKPKTLTELKVIGTATSTTTTDATSINHATQSSESQNPPSSPNITSLLKNNSNKIEDKINPSSSETEPKKSDSPPIPTLSKMAEKNMDLQFKSNGTTEGQRQSNTASGSPPIPTLKKKSIIKSDIELKLETSIEPQMANTSSGSPPIPTLLKNKTLVNGGTSNENGGQNSRKTDEITHSSSFSPIPTLENKKANVNSKLKQQKSKEEVHKEQPTIESPKIKSMKKSTSTESTTKHSGVNKQRSSSSITASLSGSKANSPKLDCKKEPAISFSQVHPKNTSSSPRTSVTSTPTASAATTPKKLVKKGPPKLTSLKTADERKTSTANAASTIPKPVLKPARSPRSLSTSKKKVSLVLDDGSIPESNASSPILDPKSNSKYAAR